MWETTFERVDTEGEDVNLVGRLEGVVVRMK
jgi:hypothetical protein